MSKPIKWGIIGCGDVTEKKSGPAFNKIEGSSLVAVMRRNSAKAQDYAARHKVPKWYDQADLLVNDKEVDAVYIATPPDSHLHYTEMVAKAGKPVYVEKPMALSFQECQAMIDACKAHKVPLFTAYYRRSLDYFNKVKELLEQNLLGKIHLVRVNLVMPARQEDLSKDTLPWRVKPEISGGGYFMDMASHQLDILDYFFGPVKKVKGNSANLQHLYPAEDFVSALFQFDQDIQGAGSWMFGAHKLNQVDEMIIYGEKGRFIFSAFEGTPIQVITENASHEYNISMPDHIQQPHIQSIIHELNGQGTCPSNGNSAARTNWVVDQIYSNS
ncbi:MAG: Gfo/Idh/MocA family protein [Candidatus Cyclobacteriaceae bacterium M3_2C_046]